MRKARAVAGREGGAFCPGERRFRCHAGCLASGDGLPHLSPSLLRRRELELRALLRLLVLPVVGDVFPQFTQSF